MWHSPSLSGRPGWKFGRGIGPERNPSELEPVKRQIMTTGFPVFLTLLVEIKAQIPDYIPGQRCAFQPVM